MVCDPCLICVAEKYLHSNNMPYMTQTRANAENTNEESMYDPHLNRIKRI